MRLGLQIDIMIVLTPKRYESMRKKKNQSLTISYNFSELRKRISRRSQQKAQSRIFNNLCEWRIEFQRRLQRGKSVTRGNRTIILHRIIGYRVTLIIYAYHVTRSLPSLSMRYIYEGTHIRITKTWSTRLIYTIGRRWSREALNPRIIPCPSRFRDVSNSAEAGICVTYSLNLMRAQFRARLGTQTVSSMRNDAESLKWTFFIHVPLLCFALKKETKKDITVFRLCIRSIFHRRYLRNYLMNF